MILDALPKKPSASHLTLDEPVTALTAIGRGISYLTHELEHAEVSAELPLTMKVAHDGLEIRL